jgi:hypothetical protein
MELFVVGWGLQGKLNVVGEVIGFACVLECVFVKLLDRFLLIANGYLQIGLSESCCFLVHCLLVACFVLVRFLLFWFDSYNSSL